MKMITSADQTLDLFFSLSEQRLTLDRDVCVLSRLSVVLCDASFEDIQLILSGDEHDDEV